MSNGEETPVDKTLNLLEDVTWPEDTSGSRRRR